MRSFRTWNACESIIKAFLSTSSLKRLSSSDPRIIWIWKCIYVSSWIMRICFNFYNDSNSNANKCKVWQNNKPLILVSFHLDIDFIYNIYILREQVFLSSLKVHCLSAPCTCVSKFGPKINCSSTSVHIKKLEGFDSKYTQSNRQ